MDWKAFNEIDLWDEINRGYTEMSPPQRWLWETIKIDPQKWQLHPWGDRGGGFWVVGLIGTTVIWYNDIEGGFNHSKYDQFGTIRDYWCNQDELNVTVQLLLDEITTGQAADGHFGPPERSP